MKATLVLIVLVGLVSWSSGLKCRKCGDDGVCDGPDDNGVVYECQGDEDTCYFRTNVGDFTVRNCYPIGGMDECWNDNDPEYGIESITCMCTGDNCNAGNRCSC